MNKELATVLRNRIASLPFIDVLAGLVQTVETESFVDGTGAKKVSRYPVSYDIAGTEICLGKEKDLQPDSSRRSIIYFEDFGSVPSLSRGGFTSYVSQVRLVAWLNRDRLVGDKYAEITGTCINLIIGKLSPTNPINVGMFTRLTIKPVKIPEQSAALFSRYTYDEKVRQYLRPPFDVFGIDLVCSYQVNSSCMDLIDFSINKDC